MSGKNKHRSTNDYLKYLKGELTSQERHSFERGLEADPFAQEAMEGLESVSAGQAEQDLLSIHNSLRKRLSRRRRVAFYSVAATVASLLIVGTVFLKVHDFNPRSQENQAYPEELFETSPKEEAESQAPEKGPSKGFQETPVPVEQEAEPDQEPETEMNRVAAPTLAPADVQEDVQEEEIIHVEAEPKISQDAVQSARTSKKARRQMAEAPDQATPMMAPNQKEMEQILTGRVSGIVISAEDQGPIPGAVVMNRDQESGVFTDLEGRFGIPVEEDSQATIIASFVGMETQEYQVADGAEVELVLQADAASLNEVLVLGYVSESADLPTGSSFELDQVAEKRGAEYSVAEPSIGFKDYKQYMEDNILFPQEEPETKKEVVVLKFTVTRAGAITDVLVLRSPGVSFTEEATRLLMDGPAWNPASNEQGTKDESVRMRIVFKR